MLTDSAASSQPAEAHTESYANADEKSIEQVGHDFTWLLDCDKEDLSKPTKQAQTHLN